MKENKTRIFCFLVFLPTFLFGQIDSNRIEIILNSCKNINLFYPDSIGANSISDSILHYYNSGKYDSITFLDDFIWELTSDLRKVSKQNHFDIDKNNVFDSASSYNTTNKKKEYRKYLKRVRKENLYFSQIEILPGNIGYIELKNFKTQANNTHYKQIKTKAALKKIRNTHALIIDLRDNEGGNLKQLINFISYFDQYLGSYYFTSIDNNQDSTDHNLDSKPPKRLRYNNKIFVLTSPKTISSGEIAAYLFKRRGNAIIIGQKTAGAGLSYGTNCQYNGVSFLIPNIKLIDTSNNYSFDTNRITPDYVVDVDSTLLFAYRLSQEDKKDSVDNARLLQMNYPELTSWYIPVYDFGRIKILKRGNSLYLKYDYRSIEKMELLSDSTYKSVSFQNIKFYKDHAGHVHHLEMISNFGKDEKFMIRNKQKH